MTDPRVPVLRTILDHVSMNSEVWTPEEVLEALDDALMCKAIYDGSTIRCKLHLGHGAAHINGPLSWLDDHVSRETSGEGND